MLKMRAKELAYELKKKEKSAITKVTGKMWKECNELTAIC